MLRSSRDFAGPARATHSFALSSRTMVANFVRTGRSIIAIGRNFAEHAKELNNAVPTEPFYFLKPTSSYVANGGKVEIPRGTVVHHESKSLL